MHRTKKKPHTFAVWVQRSTSSVSDRQHIPWQRGKIDEQHTYMHAHIRKYIHWWWWGGNQYFYYYARERRKLYNEACHIVLGFRSNTIMLPYTIFKRNAVDTYIHTTHKKTHTTHTERWKHKAGENKQNTIENTHQRYLLYVCMYWNRIWCGRRVGQVSTTAIMSK